MKNASKYIRMILLFILLNIVFIAPLPAQDPPPPPNQHGGSNNSPPGGGAPVGSGLLILSLLGLAYGTKKVFDENSKNQ